jgi:hypothetical protein
VIWHNRKFVGYTVKLETGQEKWAALSSYGALVGETNTPIEAVSLLAPDAEIGPKKTSVYLDGATAAAVRRSGQPLSELIRKGLAASPTAETHPAGEGAPADSGPSGGGQQMVM